MGKNKKLEEKGRRITTRGAFPFVFHPWTYTLYLIPFILFLFLSCSNKVSPGTESVSRQPVEGVTITTVQPSEVEDYFETSGTVKAKTISTVAGRVMGTVTSLKVKEGDRVRAGQVLMTIDDRDSAQRVAAAEKALEAAKQQRALADITFQRYKKLFDGKAVSQQEIDQIETQKKVADIEYERVRAMLAETQISHSFSRITAPTSGIVTEKKIEFGSMAVPGTPLLVVEDTSSYQIEAPVDEGLSGKLRAGMPVEIVIDSLGQRMPGKITGIVPLVDAMSRTFIAKVGVAGPSLRTGVYAKVRIPVGEKQAILVPENALVEKGQLTGVYAVDSQGVIAYRLVRPGRKYNGSVEVLSGINPGDRIITEGVQRAVDGGIVTGAHK